MVVSSTGPWAHSPFPTTPPWKSEVHARGSLCYGALLTTLESLTKWDSFPVMDSSQQGDISILEWYWTWLWTDLPTYLPTSLSSFHRQGHWSGLLPLVITVSNNKQNKYWFLSSQGTSLYGGIGGGGARCLYENEGPFLRPHIVSPFPMLAPYEYEHQV